MAIRISAATRTAMMQALADAIGSGCKWNIYSGSVHNDGVGTNPGGTKLATLTTSGAFSSSITNGVLTCTVPAADTNTVQGTAGCFQITTGAVTPVPILDGTVTATGGGGDLVLNSTAVTTGGSLSITAASFTAGNA